MKPVLSFLVALLLTVSGARAEEGSWTVLFDGSSLEGWMSAAGGPPSPNWVIEGGALVRRDKAGDIWSKERFGNFILELEFKTTGNSGVFVRTDNPRDNVQSGIEIQVDKPGGPSKHSVGALYDLVPPTKNAATPDWNKLVITASGPELSVELNGEKINQMNLDQWTTPEQNPDGSKNKFRTALKHFKRDGHIGFQDHGHGVSYRKVRVKKL